MKTRILIFILFYAFVLFIIHSCIKEGVEDIKNIKEASFNVKDQPLPPYRWFECGAPVPGSPYECPNARCIYMGYDCLPTVYIFSHKKGYYQGDYNLYQEAADRLDYYIINENTTEFFRNYPDELLILMPELGDPEMYQVFNDLKSGYTSVKKHPKFLESEEIINLYQIYIVETGEPPVYE